VNTAIGISPIFDTRRSVTEIFEDAETACKIAFSDTPDNIFVYQRDHADYDAGTLEKRILAKVGEVIENKQLLLMPAALKPLANFAGSPLRLFWLTATLPGLKNYAAAIKDLHDPTGNNPLSTAFDLCALRMFHDWAQAQPKGQAPSVHIYACKQGSILDAAFLAQLRELFVAGAPGHSLCIGIAEATFNAHTDTVLAFIDALKPLGIKFALTEFGAASLSFDYMKSLPVDYLELSATLIAGIDSDKASLVAIKFLNEIGHVLNLKTLALCAESELFEAELNRSGTDYIRNFAQENHSAGATKTAASARPFLVDGQGIKH
jgi:EAL domain-containing protein (putative c-di-GMP-specific phosphodiesterase class I)